MAKKLSLTLGIIFVIIGVLGYIPNPLISSAGIFATNHAHDIVHILTGIIFIIAGVAYQNAVSAVLKTFGVIYLIVAILGFFAVDATTGTGSVLSFLTVNKADNWLHVVLAIIVFAAGIIAAKNGSSGEMASAAPSTPAPAAPTSTPAQPTEGTGPTQQM